MEGHECTRCRRGTDVRSGPGSGSGGGRGRGDRRYN